MPISWGFRGQGIRCPPHLPLWIRGFAASGDFSGIVEALAIGSSPRDRDRAPSFAARAGLEHGSTLRASTTPTSAPRQPAGHPRPGYARRSASRGARIMPVVRLQLFRVRLLSSLATDGSRAFSGLGAAAGCPARPPAFVASPGLCRAFTAPLDGRRPIDFTRPIRDVAFAGCRGCSGSFSAWLLGRPFRSACCCRSSCASR